MLGNLYYIIGLFIMILSFSNLLNFLKFNKIRNWVMKFKKVTKNDVTIEDFKKESDYNLFTLYSSFIVIEFVWLLLGLTSNNWYLFLILISLNSIYKFNINIVSTTIGFIFSVFKFISILFLIINHFHLHLNIIDYI